ncbi:glutamine-hydrolyzing carbamoyl-phosphate synthase small subunit [Brevundimonas sp. 3P9-tot-E]|uniref:glutamine-hydrolyzing carbamoyl-phosphate synthase small subunit n=1 Tax=Brevundimonas TaxID=41275 RepID=UPI0019054539|nr:MULTISPECIES: glutamine-hydrolyzing carbamoyl-phosphate synthase small subunit [Brevundimonas]MBK1969082.1 glutamine-hydrolyzing carbamoyl-phosphate synthase small subunit [Brevundimonas diminuta]MDA0743502.1 glutamine-hydrolyzing carbamoyl-phosphate synthase small subunit [Pseudomonadota bacterium]MDA1321294.1 glutamine-hydrolyzing carbamoyl-phosphate synthase small subunit [Pseudomonadota bacterium]MDM8354136.1 glutamine-hydrolyzing carbamoyl-phosphate synthase small subunit [Brevundimonas
MTTQILSGATGVLVLADGTVLSGIGVGATGSALGEVVFNTSMTGYQEILTDPSYMSQILAFTFPHIGNVGVNLEDVEQVGEAPERAARGVILRDVPTDPANWRATGGLDAWMKSRGVIGLAGVDTRALTQLIREKGAPHAVIAHDPEGKFDLEALTAQARDWKGLVGLDLAKDASTTQAFEWTEGAWEWPTGYAQPQAGDKSVVVVDYGVKRNILRALASTGVKITVVPASTTAEDILARNPDGVVLSNGPGDPAATGEYAVPEIRKLLDSGKPLMGICLGHQMLAIALGAKTLKMEQGHHGANHPVKDLTTGKVEIVSMNHEFSVDRDSLPEAVVETHVSLFDDTNCGIALKDKPVFSVQHHPEASSGPTDSLYLFKRFVDSMRA